MIETTHSKSQVPVSASTAKIGRAVERMKKMSRRERIEALVRAGLIEPSAAERALGNLKAERE